MLETYKHFQPPRASLMVNWKEIKSLFPNRYSVADTDAKHFGWKQAAVFFFAWTVSEIICLYLLKRFAPVPMGRWKVGAF